ncbi:protein ORF14 [Anguillid herpesvirus 1]|uniref:Protein ORF14 n=1 Tax=Anguillid herpesvirus 1 TaxID=150286 RepID=A0A1J0RE76_9VIRU|nr:protein ORF14 [Anguillid herpesvirus 1]ADA57777.1 protein ORF14 [Anguillid herpesvirus 1]APD76177.1 ORF14 [Anguillid herpesvirus 1]QRM16309.1 protein ORF14 [Anguillid herpesvirus 1]QRM16440.1 protein ORF14 [Anguillid herpesvirus 1]QRM16568.1 protein ORF14 [Anguillid herpesvirus 1]
MATFYMPMFPRPTDRDLTAPKIPTDEVDEQHLGPKLRARVCCFTFLGNWFDYGQTGTNVAGAQFSIENNRFQVHPWFRRRLANLAESLNQRDMLQFHPDHPYLISNFPKSDSINMVVDNYIWQSIFDLKQIWTDEVLARTPPPERRAALKADCVRTAEEIYQWVKMFAYKRHNKTDAPGVQTDKRFTVVTPTLPDIATGTNSLDQTVGLYVHREPLHERERTVDDTLYHLNWESKDVAKFIYDLFILHTLKDRLRYDVLYGPDPATRIGPGGSTIVL